MNETVVLEIDGKGRILTQAGRIGSLLDVAGEDLTGLDLFRDVAPAMNVPAVRGRFLDAARSDGFPISFLFSLGREERPVELDIRFDQASAPGCYRVELVLRRVFDPSRQREAMLAVGSRVRAEPVDPSVCEREPIHIPGFVQPSAALLGIDPATLTVRVASENIADVLGLSTADVIGTSLRDLLPAAFAERLRADMIAGEIVSSVPRRFEVDLGEPVRPYTVMVHLHDERLILEFEVAPVHGRDFGAVTQGELRNILAELRAEPTEPGLLDATCHLVRRITGFERVLVYRFDADWNGEAVAESVAESWGECLLGLHFPASDIPRQARELYTKSPSRFVIDRDAAPVPLTAAATENRPIDLTYALSRSLSPIHIEYQRNLGVNGSMSVAIMVEGRLWGLLIGHHRRPHYVSPETRDAVATIVESVGLMIQQGTILRKAAEQEAHVAVELALLEQMARADDFVTALAGDKVRLTNLFGATGAAVVTGAAATTIGRAPSADKVEALAARLRAEVAEEAFATDHLAALDPTFENETETASGVLAVFVGTKRQTVLIWFRPEVASTIVWSGNPEKPVLADPQSLAVLPRRSFERWVEERRGTSTPWAPWQIEIASRLARAVDGVALGQSRRVVELSRNRDELLAALHQKDRLIQEKDLLSREIDHRVKNSLQIVSAFLSMQSRQIDDPDAKAAFNDTYARVTSIARVHDSLYQSDTVTDVDLGQTIENLCRDLSGMTGSGRDIALKAEQGLMVPYRKAVALCLIAAELVTNAWKYAYPNDEKVGSVEVRVRRVDDGSLQLRVCDDGPGLPVDWKELPKKGLGMQLIRAMLSQIDGTMEVESDNGACFTVLC